jgi:hypothetical protein
VQIQLLVIFLHSTQCKLAALMLAEYMSVRVRVFCLKMSAECLPTFVLAACSAAVERLQAQASALQAKSAAEVSWQQHP